MRKALFYILLLLTVHTYSQVDTTGTTNPINDNPPTIQNNSNLFKIESQPNSQNPVIFENKNKAINTEAINQQIAKTKPKDKNFDMTGYHYPDDDEIIDKKYWMGKEVKNDRLKSNQFLGTIRSETNSLRIECRDHSLEDGDMVKVYLNEKVVIANIPLKNRYYAINIDLEPGFNRIDFQALNQGYSGPNTAQFRVYDDKGNLVSSKEWNIETGFIATLCVIKK